MELFSILENVKQAKDFLDKKGIDASNDPNYLSYKRNVTRI
jgi:hypothetical protein